MHREIEDLRNNYLAKTFGKNGVEKHTRYNWCDLDEPGQFQHFDKRHLDIDRLYQREGSVSKIRQIARDFSWALFGCLIVIADEEKTKLFVVDGGHRLRAALLREDVTDVPCMVYQRERISEEAKIFFDTQIFRTGMRAFDRHRAGLVAKKPVAIDAQKLVERHGYNFSKHGGEECTTAAIFTVYRMIERNAEIADVTFDILAKVAQGGPIKNSEFTGLFYLMTMNPAINFYTFPFDNMAKIGLAEIEKAITKWTNAMGHGGEKQFAQGMLEIINKGQSKNKVIVPN